MVLFLKGIKGFEATEAGDVPCGAFRLFSVLKAGPVWGNDVALSDICELQRAGQVNLIDVEPILPSSIFVLDLRSWGLFGAEGASVEVQIPNPTIDDVGGSGGEGKIFQGCRHGIKKLARPSDCSGGGPFLSL